MALATAGYLAAYAFFLDRAPFIRRLLSLLPNGVVLFGLGRRLQARPLWCGGLGVLHRSARPAVGLRPRIGRSRALSPARPVDADPGRPGVGVRSGQRLLAATATGGAARLVAAGPPAAAAPSRRRRCPLLVRRRAVLAAANRRGGTAGTGSSSSWAWLDGPARAARSASDSQRLPSRDGTRSMGGHGLRESPLFVHLVLAPIATPFAAGHERVVGDRMRGDRERAERCRDRRAGPHRGDSPDHVLFGHRDRRGQADAGLPTPRHIRVLANGKSGMRVRRTDERTLEVASGRTLPRSLQRLLPATTFHSSRANASSSRVHGRDREDRRRRRSHRDPLSLRPAARGPGAALGALGTSGYVEWNLRRWEARSPCRPSATRSSTDRLAAAAASRVRPGPPALHYNRYSTQPARRVHGRHCCQVDSRARTRRRRHRRRGAHPLYRVDAAGPECGKSAGAPAHDRGSVEDAAAVLGSSATGGAAGRTHRAGRRRDAVGSQIASRSSA